MKICKDGIVREISPDGIKVGIIRQEACDTCRLQAYCHPVSSREQILEIKCENAQKWHQGDKVELSLSEKTLLKSVFWSYILPLLLLVGGIFAAVKFGLNETQSGISGIIVLIMYYFGLFLSNGFFADRINYEIKSIDRVSDDDD